MFHDVEVNKKDLKRLLVALEAEADGAEFRADLARKFAATAAPAAAAARAAIMSMSSKRSAVPGLRSAIAARTKVVVRLSSRSPQVAIKASGAGMPRGFRTAPHHTNAAKGWRRKVYGDPKRWVHQMGLPGWFDDTIAKFAPAVRRDAGDALDNMADRVSARTKR